MSEIPFINELGDRLELAAQRSLSQRHRWVQRPRRHGRLVVVLALLALGGGVATAATVLSSSTTTLVAAGISCLDGTRPDNFTSATGGVNPLGHSPTAACARLIGRPASALIACESGRYGIDVLVRTGPAERCRALGMARLPLNYGPIATRLVSLDHALRTLYESSNCVSYPTFKADVEAIVSRFGLVGWRVSGTRLGGRCGLFPASGSNYSDWRYAVQGHGQTVDITSGPPRSVYAASSQANVQIEAATNARCLTVTELRSLIIDGPLRTLDLPFRFAVTAINTTTGNNASTVDAGGPYGNRYAQGCAVPLIAAPNAAATAIDSWIAWRGARVVPDWSYSPPGGYR